MKTIQFKDKEIEILANAIISYMGKINESRRNVASFNLDTQIFDALNMDAFRLLEKINISCNESETGNFRTVLVDRRTGKPVKMKNGGEWYGITLEEADRIAQGMTIATTVKNAGVDIYDLNTGEIVSRIN